MVKRKRLATVPAPQSDAKPPDGSISEYEVVADDYPIDISSILAAVDHGDADDDIEGLIRSQQEKQNVRAGAKAVKNVVKGQSKQGTSAMGGGSFQSMGACIV